MKRSGLLFAALLASALLAAPPPSDADPTLATAGVGGSYPAGTSFAGVSVNGLQSGFGVEINLDGSGLGQFCAVLLGTSGLGLPQNIRLEGEVTAGSHPTPNVAILSGTARIDMGDGLPAAEGVPFTATVTTDAAGQGTIGLVTGLASLPNATVNAGSMTIN
jgi:hypothetical protein